MTFRVERKGVWPWLVAVALVAIFSTALSWTYSTNTLSNQAGRLDAVDLALGSSAVTRAGASQAVLVATNHSGGTASTEALSIAIAELAANLDAYDALASEVGSPDSEFVALSREIISLLQAGSVDGARAAFEGPLQAAYAADIATLSRVRQSVVADIDAAASFAAAISSWLRIAAVLAVPIAAAATVHLLARRRLHEERRQLLDVVQESGAEAAAAAELLTDASHRLRTPLTSIYGLSEVLAQSKRVSGLERELATLVHAEAAEMNRVADDVLILSQRHGEIPDAAAEIVALSEVVDEATRAAKSTGVEIKVECPQVWVLSDRTKVTHVIRNLVSNAVSHGAEPVFVEVSEVDGRVECVVVDHGPGLPGGVEPDRGRFGFAGHGLEIAYHLAERIGAQLTYRRDGDQTRFCLAFTDEGSSQAGTRDNE